MIVNVDFSALEWRVALYYSQDPVGLQEIKDKFDQHADNQKRWGFPEGEQGRTKAKRFVFKLLYGGSAYGYAVDSEFNHISDKEAFWQEVIDKFYTKYKGIKRWHDKILLEARSTGRLVTPSGVEYKFSPVKSKYGDKWPDTYIKNYPVQGFGAEIVKLARIMLFRRLIKHRDNNILLVNTVHDSIMVDCANNQVSFVVSTIKQVLADLPETISKTWGIDYNLPTDGDIKIGSNWLELNKLETT